MKTLENHRLPMEFRKATHEALVSVWWTGLLLKKTARRFFKDLGTTEARFNLLMALHYSSEPLKQRDLSRRLMVDKSNVTGLVDDLEREGLIRRKGVPGDRRSYHVELTPRGRRAVRSLDGKYQEKVNAVMRHLAPAECEGLTLLTARIRQGLAEDE